MTDRSSDQLVQVEVSPDRMEAWLVVKPGVRAESITPSFRDALLEQAGIRGNHDVVTAFDKALAEPFEPGQTVRRCIARGKPPVDGVDGAVEWAFAQEAEAEKKKNDSVSWYERSTIRSVSPGEVLGKLTSPTSGRPGVDITGQELPARDGQPTHFKADESITIQADGTMIAGRQGVLSVSRNKASIQECLHIEKNVDFSTGNIDFVGDVIVSHDVRDRFVVKATGNVIVHGLIEAATIECDGDLQALGGFAGRERGNATVGGDCHARYLNEVQATVLGDLAIDREVINSQLVVHGNLATHGAIIGGDITVAGRSEIKTIGSEAGVRTVLHMGAAPRFEQLAARLEKVIDALEEERQRYVNDHKQLEQTGRMRQLSKEEQGQAQAIEQRAYALGQRLREAREVLGEFTKRIEEQRVFDVRITGKIHAGVELQTPTAVFHVHRDIVGPIHISRDKLGNLTYSNTRGSRGLLGQITQTHLAAA